MSSPFRTLTMSAGIALAACSGDGTGPNPTTFDGTWVAAKVEYISVANPATRVEVIALGASLTVQFNGNGSYASTLTMPGETPEATAGTWNASAEVFTLTWAEGGVTHEMQFDWTMSGATLTLVGADSDFDFAGDGEFLPAKLNVTLVRQ